jgi:hypothetical protein
MKQLEFRCRQHKKSRGHNNPGRYIPSPGTSCSQSQR